VIGCPDWERGWTWVASPTSHIESGNRFWVDPELTYDGDCNTRGSVLVNKDSPFTPTNRIRWLFDSVECEGVRLEGFVTGSYGAECWCFVRAVVNGEVVHFLPWGRRTLDLNRVWEFERGVLTEFVVQIDFMDYGHAQLYVSEIAAGIKAGVCPGPLGDICAVFHGVGDFFSDLATAIAGVFIIGEYLSRPFSSLGNTFHDLGDTCCEASATLQEILDLLEGGITWDEISAMIREHWPWLAALIDDPIAWLLSLLQEHFTPLYYLIVDPAGELLYMIAQLFNLEPYQAQTGEMVVKALFERYFPELYLLWRDPDAWLQQRLEPILAAFLAEIREWLEATWQKLLDTYEDAFEAISDKLYYLAEHTVRFFWEGEW